MKQYQYPLMTSGLFLILLGQQPLLAVEESHSFLEQGKKTHQQEIDKTILPKISSLLQESPDRPTDEEMKRQTQRFFTEGLEPLEVPEKKQNKTLTKSLAQEEAIPSKDLFIAQMPTYSPPPGQTFPSPVPSTPVQPSPSQDVLVPNPDVMIRSNGSSIPDSLQPTMPVAPTLPRAIAPPVGDMAISNIDAGQLGVSGNQQR